MLDADGHGALEGWDDTDPSVLLGVDQNVECPPGMMDCGEGGVSHILLSPLVRRRSPGTPQRDPAVQGPFAVVRSQMPS